MSSGNQLCPNKLVNPNARFLLKRRDWLDVLANRVTIELGKGPATVGMLQWRCLGSESDVRHTLRALSARQNSDGTWAL